MTDEIYGCNILQQSPNAPLKLGLLGNEDLYFEFSWRPGKQSHYSKHQKDLIDISRGEGVRNSFQDSKSRQNSFSPITAKNDQTQGRAESAEDI